MRLARPCSCITSTERFTSSWTNAGRSPAPVVSATAAHSSCVARDAEDQRLDDDVGCHPRRARHVDRVPAVAVVAPERAVGRWSPTSTACSAAPTRAQTGRSAITPSTAARSNHPLAVSALTQLLLGRDAVGGDRREAARGQLAHQRLLAGHAQRVVIRHDQRRHLLAEEVDRAGVHRLPLRAEPDSRRTATRPSPWPPPPRRTATRLSHHRLLAVVRPAGSPRRTRDHHTSAAPADGRSGVLH